MKMMPPDVISHENQLQHLSEPSIFILDVFRTADHAGQIFIPHRLPAAICAKPASRCPVTESPPRSLPRRLYFDTDSPPEDLFQNRFAPRRLYSKPKSPGGETISSPVEINSPRRRVYFDAS